MRRSALDNRTDGARARRSIRAVTRLPSRRTRARLTAPVMLLLILLALVASGCGGSSKAAGGSANGGGTDPASVAPPGSALYLSLIVRPQGTTKANVDQLGRTILATNDFPAELERLIAKSSTGTKDLDVARDVEPWLGDRLALALPSFSTKGDGLLIAATTDDDKARAGMARGIPSPADATYRGVDYQHSADGKHAGAVVDHLALYGPEADVKRAIDASQDTSLSETRAYTAAVERLPGDALATGYLDLRNAITTAGAAAGQGAATGLFGSVLGKGVAGIGLGAYADADAIRLEVAVPGTGAIGGGLSGGDAATALQAAPAGAWLGVGLGNIGTSLGHLLDGLSAGGGLGSIGVGALLGQAQQAIGLDVRKDLLAWMGSAHIFVSGTTRETVGGALVVHSTDPAATRRAVNTLATSIPRLMRKNRVARISGPASGFSIALGKTTRATIAVKGDTFIIAIGDAALKQALAVGDRLGDAPAFKASADRLNGARPVLYLDLQQVADLVASLGGTKAQGAVDVLRRFTQLAAGGKADGDVSRATIVAGVNVK